mgnify:CR=1 FL=1
MYDTNAFEYFPDLNGGIGTGDYIRSDDQYVLNGTSTSGTIRLDSIKNYDIQTVSVEPGDVILAHISADMNIDECQAILEELNKAFPENTVLLVNEYVLKGMTILHNKGYKKENQIVDEGFIYRPLEEQYPELFSSKEVLW